MMGVPDQQVGYSPLHQHYGAPPTPLDNEMNYYYSHSPKVMPPGAHPQHFQQIPMPPQPTIINSYGNSNMSAPSPTRMNQIHAGLPYNSGHYQPYTNASPGQRGIVNPQWIDIQEEGAFVRAQGGDQP
jgi:hypothetical protein